ncbi:MAG: archease, partial [Candidatus Micrarchaeaceae archaeon]
SNKKKFRYISHTADVSFFGYGKTYEECFKNSAEAMFNLIFNSEVLKNKKTKFYKIKIIDSAKTIDDLLWFFLQDIVSKIYSDNISILKIKKIIIENRLGSYRINAILLYTKNFDQNNFLMDVKAVTPHNLFITKYKNGLRSRVILDI